ncbi:MAG: glucokinase, partial [Nocardioidaceae bacterium]|nr:glucokinase [Nocardioidaceae bacterium]
HGPSAVLETAVGLLRNLDRSDVRAVGVASAGVVDPDRGTVVGATDSIAGWTGTALTQRLAADLELPVFALGDGHAFALGESCYGAGRGADSLLVLAAGTGVGGSYVSALEPMFGSHAAGGHFGHVSVPEAVGLLCDCGVRGHVEAVAGGAGMVREYHRRGGDGAVRQALELFSRCATDEHALAAVRLGAAGLGTAAAGLANAFDPAMVVLAGGLTRAGGTWTEQVAASFRASLMPALSEMPLVISAPGDWLALRGAAYYAARRMEGL